MNLEMLIRNPEFRLGKRFIPQSRPDWPRLWPFLASMVRNAPDDAGRIRADLMLYGVAFIAPDPEKPGYSRTLHPPLVSRLVGVKGELGPFIAALSSPGEPVTLIPNVTQVNLPKLSTEQLYEIARAWEPRPPEKSLDGS